MKSNNPDIVTPSGLGATIEQIAKVAYEIISAYSMAIGEGPRAEWANADVDAQDAYRVGVLRAINNPDISAAEYHQYWKDCKEHRGWCWDVTTNVERRLHSNLREYFALPTKQQVKRTLFISTVKSMINC